jgi:hypothetical protein
MLDHDVRSCTKSILASRELARLFLRMPAATRRWRADLGASARHIGAEFGSAEDVYEIDLAGTSLNFA